MLDALWLNLPSCAPLAHLELQLEVQGLPAHLELQLESSGGADHLSQADGTAVAQLPRPEAKLMAAIALRICLPARKVGYGLSQRDWPEVKLARQ